MANKVDPDLYHQLCKPFESAEDAQKALDAFFEEVYALRVKYKLADVSVLVQSSIVGSGPFLWSAHCGSQSEVEGLAAWYFGQAQADRQDRIRRAMEDCGKIYKAAKR